MLPIVASSMLFAVGGVFMKPAEGFSRLLPSLAVLGCFAVGSVLLSVAVHRGNLSTTYVIGLGIEAVVAIGIGLFLLGERLALPQIAGVLLIVGGLALVRSA
ncbi:MAG: SMR family transporter [Acidimicrobiales bacterium]|jgi:multidrug transporter EmrE-like cation transporter|nr:SMR family transporter [Acidimicrobiales bacterium]